ncbi:hypothetical protein [Desulfosarcina alkanivorans]|nr:hypothetical protein [Desulfosarcina alkanivorans]
MPPGNVDGRRPHGLKERQRRYARRNTAARLAPEKPFYSYIPM